MGAVISKNNKPIAFYSWKLNPAQKNYTTTEEKLLTIVKTLKEFKNILLAQKICVYTDHKNITYKAHNFSRVMCWQVLIEEFGPELFHLPGKINVVAYCLSRLKHDNHDVASKHFALGVSDLNEYPLSY